MTTRLRALALALLMSAGAGAGQTFACSCAPPPEHLKSKAELDAWHVQQASTVVRGRVIDVRAPAGGARSGVQYVTVRFDATLVIKGDVSAGRLEILTFTEGSMCGIPEFLSDAAHKGIDVVLELGKNVEGRYLASTCGLFSPAASMKQDLISKKRT